jgi:hypothetical protein
MKQNPGGGTQTAAAVFFDQVASAILAQHAHELPDLRRVVVLLPNYHVAVPLAQHLARVSGLPALLLPQMVTLNDWAQSVPLAQAITPDSCRATTLYQALRSGSWFPDADLWGIATELLGLIDELTRHRVPQAQCGACSRNCCASTRSCISSACSALPHAACISLAAACCPLSARTSKMVTGACSA